ncbi:Mu transposase C-terminal domain-containing protein [Fundidesulfovibrio butyratiphilus]
MVTAKDIAQALNVSERAVRARAVKDAWVFEEVRCRGGKRRLYPVGSLPDDARQAFATAMLAETSAPAIPAAAPLSGLTARQRETALARLAFVREIERAAALVGKEKAIRNLLQALEDGSLAPRLAELVRVANDRFGSGAHRGLSRRRLYDWCAKFAEGGEAALAPRHKGKDMHWPEWADAFLAHYQRPQKPAMTNAYKDFKAEWPGKAPSIFAVRRWLDKLAMPDREAGRATGNALLKLRPHKRRSTDELWPTDIYTADGTTFDAEIRHPLHGQPFKPEVTLFIDVATRRCVGLSLGLAESGYVILDALRMACLFGGIPAMLYTDNGSGYCNQLMTAEGSGMMDRLGIEMTHSIPGRPQGKGLMERAVQTVCEPVSKRFATCSHADMDPDAAKKVFHITRARKQGESSLLPSWEEFKAAMLVRVEEYNAAPHRGLPKVEDQSTGRRRHLSPNEAWEGFLRRGWEPVRVPEAIRDELFMPGLPRQVRNGEIQIFNSTYYADELADFHKEYVEVRYDIWDPSKVYAWTTRGEKICTATLDGNSIPYFPQSRVEAALEKREKAQLARVGKKVAAISPGATIQVAEAPRTVTVVADSLTRQPEAQVLDLPIQQSAEVSMPAKRPFFTSIQERYAWLMRNRDRWTEADHGWMTDYVRSPHYADLHDYYRYEGIAWDGSAAQATNH